LSDTPHIEYRSVSELEELSQVIDVQREVWGFADVEVIPARLFLIAHRVGGQVIGAFDGPRLIGYCFSIPGIRREDGSTYLHSHMLAVLPPYRNLGVGRRLKLEQRADALARGIGLIEWTFDPLELKNAFFNIERLGVIVRRYILNNYGVTTSRLHAGLPTDRCVAEWRLAHPRTEAILEGRSREREPPAARISVPADIGDIKSRDPESAIRIQSEVSRRFLEHLDAGLAVTGFERSAEAGTYVLSRWP
jgi:predicted GNAT superfamily acetyltransferase